MFFKNNNTFRTILFIIIAIFFVWAIAQIKEIALLFFGAFVIACSLNPIVDKLEQKIPRALATTLVILLATAVILVVFLPVFFVAIKEFKALFSMIPDTLRNFSDWINTLSVAGYKVSDFISMDSANIDSGSVATNIIDKSVSITMGILDGMTVILSIAMVVFYLVWEKKEINKSILKWFPPRMKRRAAEIITTIETKVGGYVFAQVLSMSTVAFFTVLGLMMCNIKYAFLLGIIAGILDIIPIVGPTIALVLGCSSAIANGWIWIIPTIAVYLIAQWISNQLVRPVVFGKFMQLHPIVVLFSFFVCAKFLGVWGVIIAPAIAATIITLFDELYVKTINSGKNQ